MRLSFNDVNRKYSFTWVKCNDDARSEYFRSLFISKHGGEFVRSGKYWEWNPRLDQMIKLESSLIQPASKENAPRGQKTWIFVKEDTEYTTKNVQVFCKEHKLTRSSLYEVIVGKRKSHKGFSLKEIIVD